LSDIKRCKNPDPPKRRSKGNTRKRGAVQRRPSKRAKRWTGPRHPKVVAGRAQRGEIGGGKVERLKGCPKGVVQPFESIKCHRSRHTEIITEPAERAKGRESAG